jgi:subtilase family serine protease
MFEDRVLLSGIVAQQPADLHAAVPAADYQGVIVPVSSSISAPGYAHTFLEKISYGSGAEPLAGPGPPSSALTPAQIRHIYSLDQISNLGQGQTIAIVNAYDDPNIFSDADTFDEQSMTTLTGSTSYYTAYGASSTWLTKVYASGTTPQGNTAWGQEISLDVEWMHAIAPQAKIILVEAASDILNDLLNADLVAVQQGATVVSNSWGDSEFSGENNYDSYFSASHVTFVFSAGDTSDQSYPAESPNVLSVGGTTLYHDANYNWSNEVGWSSGGGGVSRYEAKPSYQSGLSYANRAGPDVAYDADPNTGFAVYDSYGNYGWGQYGGTSVGAPQWSALIALANQGRAADNEAPLDGLTQTLPDIYAMTTGTTGTEQLNDVTSGSNSVGSAGPGYDLVTGQGTPRRADLVYQAFVSTFSIGDPGFEQVVVGAGNFQYDPTGSPWAFSGGAGISGNNSGFTSGNPPAPQGSQVAFLQGTGLFTQSVAGWAAGSYVLTFDAAQRENYQASQQNLNVLIDGNVVGTFTPSGTSYQSYSTTAFTVTAGAHTITFQGLDSAGGDNTTFLDQIAVAPASTPSIGDPGFEQVVVGAGNFQYDPTGSPWTFSGGAGISGNNSGFTSGNPPAPQGVQVAFLQGTGLFTQSVAGWAAGSYVLTFDAAQRENYQASQENFNVLIDGSVVGTFTPSGTSYQSYSTTAFTVVTAGAHTITFQGLDSAGGDNTAFLDAVTIS